jgi:hypothetical protein
MRIRAAFRYFWPIRRYGLSGPAPASSKLGYKLSFHDLTDEAEGKERQNKTKFSCPGCGCNAWGKPDLHIGCLDCRKPMESTKQQ